MALHFRDWGKLSDTSLSQYILWRSVALFFIIRPYVLIIIQFLIAEKTHACLFQRKSELNWDVFWWASKRYMYVHFLSCVLTTFCTCDFFFAITHDEFILSCSHGEEDLKRFTFRIWLNKDISKIVIRFSLFVGIRRFILKLR